MFLYVSYKGNLTVNLNVNHHIDKNKKKSYFF